jgi:Flp pilus assembly pilin Flp
MRNTSVGQVLILVVICFLLFGDLNNVKKKVKAIFKNVNHYFDEKKNRKKGT